MSTFAKLTIGRFALKAAVDGRRYRKSPSGGYRRPGRRFFPQNEGLDDDSRISHVLIHAAETSTN